MLTREDARMLMEQFAIILKNDSELRNMFAEEMAKVTVAGNRLISLKEAAGKIGRSASWLYKHKDDEYGHPNFKYEKSGSAKSSTVMFYECSLIEDYQRYVSNHRKVVSISDGMRMTV